MISTTAKLAAAPVASQSARRPARVQVKAVAVEKKQDVAQRRAVFTGLAAAAAAALAPRGAVAEEERSKELISRLCASNPTSKACLENSAKRQ
uniref:Uncharacterized protein n=1 Tax=Tetraselmis sp. GSL018 TaxID=582737 RepID=A0A061S9P2_9CHLO|mmetsp:Transcript_6127/g.14791  ORF Transcript_6127/g.14791 Transcript_6127/m.14791 type:complete len:93 (-) Transcript_6127:111-389(-)|eukprot:CAMPEP_0177598806 /NCGR_PEP_ID=MMETSP0419_2-20121207/12597_1 /TAXON_ID=582737 /ORGANISM="Tetraselmis sp., Strain GSL018" /LENGTH=92 /DNA_ID=CAMNT_0019091379 /DNA_START=52 /DNA_END=330 /DNA_ORIENTATION=-